MELFGISLFWKHAGLVTFSLPEWVSKDWDYTVHIGVCRDCHVWGRKKWWWSGPAGAFGLGPLVQVCWIWK